jgi:ATP-dependent DNA helicase RecG
MIDIDAIVDLLRQEGGDLPSVEVKSAAGGLPESLVPTMCAFANRPGGGTIILGLDEAAGFTPVSLSDPLAMKSALSSKARHALEPPLVVSVEDAIVDGEPIIVTHVSELDPSQKPCRVPGGRHRGVWVRAWDGDYQAADTEIQGLLTHRTQPRFDAEPAPGATRNDLDPVMVRDFLTACRNGSEQLSQFREDDELLWRMGVVVGSDRVPSVAGILALGVYPQQHLPSTGLQAVLAPAATDRPGTRARDSRRFDGPISRMLTDATSWVARSSASAIRSNPAGNVVSVPEWPTEAVREIIANALIHRDLAPWSLGETALVRLDPDRFVVRNPGGLYGLNVSRLGQIGVTSARNAILTRICQYILLPDGTRAVEALASGIPTILHQLQQAGLPAPTFDDSGLRFTVILRQGLRPAVPVVRPGSTTAKVLASLGGGRRDVSFLAKATGLTEATIRHHLRDLRGQGLVVRHGGPGLPTTYERTDRS